MSSIAAFLVDAGGTRKIVIVDKNQVEDVHCNSHGSIENVWRDDVCENVLNIKGGLTSSMSKVIRHDRPQPARMFGS